MDMDGFQEFVYSVNWLFAKTMPENPHEYTLRKHAPEAQFIAAVEAIRREGECRIFGGRPYIKWDVNGWTYWTMGAPLSQTILINRSKHD